MNILFIHQHFPGQFKFLAPALVKNGHHVSALCINPDKGFSATGIDVHQYQTERGTTPNIHPWVMDLETKVIRAEACFKAAMKFKESGYRPDLIIAHIGWGETLFIKEVWPDAKLVIYGEFYYHASGADVGFDPEFPALESAACAMRAKNLNNIAHFDIADAGISPTEWQKSSFPEPFRSKITVIHDGIDTDTLAPNSNASLSLTIGNQPPLVLTKKDEILTFVNRNLEPYRGYHTFMRSLPAILKDRPNLKVLIVGGDKVSYGAAPDPNIYGKRSWKEIFANELRPHLTEAQWNQLIFVGNVPYAYFVPLLQLSTVHVYLTYPFILSWSLLEAMSIGCAIVGSNTAPVQEVIEHNTNGLLVDFFKPQDLANAVTTLLDDPGLREKLGKRARKTAVEKYDLKRVCLPKALGFVKKELQKQNSQLKHQHKVALEKKEKKKNLLLNKKKSNKESSPTQKEINNLLEHYQKGQYNFAEDLSKDFTKKYPNHQFGWKVLGAVFKKTGRLEEALIANQKAVNLSPKDAEAHSNLGTTLQKIGRLDDAVESYRAAIAIKPEYAEAHNNLSVALKEIGKLDNAVASCRKAIEINPEYAEAYCNLGLALEELGKVDDALLASIKSIDIKPTNKAKSLFIELTKRINIQTWDPSLAQYVVTALVEPWGRPSGLIRFACRLLKTDKEFVQILKQLKDSNSDTHYGDSLLSIIFKKDFNFSSLLGAMLSSSPIPDPDIELFLTYLRRHLIKIVSAKAYKVGDEVDFLYCSLAHQCFINEYVFYQTSEEIEDSNQLLNQLIQAMEDGHHIPGIMVVVVACYFPLFSIVGAERLLQQEWTDNVKKILKQQIIEPLEEVNLKASIEVLSSIDNKVSLEVQSQYEENPYPRWVSLPKLSSREFINSLQRKFPQSSFKQLVNDEHPKILIAGCGTGQHSIGTSQSIQGASILAVDLSLASLAYAKRKTIELGITNIEYAQADLLKLGTLDQTFDVIESSGVLHHLENPFEGWEVLLSLLRPYGLMRLGFYSELSRQDVVKVHKLISKQGIGSSSQEIRDLRKNLLRLNGSEDYRIIVNRGDFFSTSACRDLLFHIQEHRMNLNALAGFIKEHDLNFLGFDIDSSVIRTYKNRFPNDQSATNLDQWHIYEKDNPDTFRSMYQFWVQKQH